MTAQTVGTSVPHSFVLADLFDVGSLELETPAHVLDLDPTLELVPCPDCEGLGWFECYGSAYAPSCAAWGRPDLDFVLKPCTRCHTTGEVLDSLEPAPLSASAPLCERCLGFGWIDAEHTAKTRAAGFKWLLGVGVCPCGAWRDRLAA
jgi:hypothetical protein